MFSLRKTRLESEPSRRGRGAAWRQLGGRCVSQRWPTYTATTNIPNSRWLNTIAFFPLTPAGLATLHDGRPPCVSRTVKAKEERARRIPLPTTPSPEIPQHLLLLTAHTTLAQERQVAKPNLEGAGTCNTPGVQGAGEELRQAWPASAVLRGVQNSKRILQTSISFCQSEIAKALLSVTTN